MPKLKEKKKELYPGMPISVVPAIQIDLFRFLWRLNIGPISEDIETKTTLQTVDKKFVVMQTSSNEGDSRHVLAFET